MENQDQQDTAKSSGESGGKSPRKRKLFFTLVLVLIVVGMYAGTYYKIVVYGP